MISCAGAWLLMAWMCTNKFRSNSFNFMWLREFKNTFCGKTGKRIKLTEVGGQFSSQRETVNPPCIVPADHS
ncbi:hypothetical protein AAFF_G00142160 [Aldrovandia affinis]|uniref:Uncharacterized protein n=1 Tax=Aldrovandia affinis TaxID=143900 RepID=A0AAD7T041_9TELE|nr:hypothetical protein AAFF_G00142160 [Aldrovandia affinis]